MNYLSVFFKLQSTHSKLNQINSGLLRIEKRYDIIVIGAGIIGLSTAYKLIEKNPSLSICILEKESKIASHQTGHNSGVIHSGIYYKPGSLKASNCIKGYRLLIDFCDELNVKYEICGKVIIASYDEQLPALERLFERGKANGLVGIKFISGNEIKEYEPFAKGIKGIFVPQTGITDYTAVSEKIAELISHKGCVIKLNEFVKDISLKKNTVYVNTHNSQFESSVLVSCAGLNSDEVAMLTNSNLNFRIIPFRGEYYKLSDEKKYFVRNLIYPVPDPEFPFLGVHFTRRIGGMIEAGPNAVLALKKEGYQKTDFNLKDAINTLSYNGFHKIALKYWKTGVYEFYRSFSKKKFAESLRTLIPEVNEADLVSGGSGVRAQACDVNGNLIDDFLFLENERMINVCNAPSPGATSCFSIGGTIAEKIFKAYF